MTPMLYKCHVNALALEASRSYEPFCMKQIYKFHLFVVLVLLLLHSCNGDLSHRTVFRDIQVSEVISSGVVHHRATDSATLHNLTHAVEIALDIIQHHCTNPELQWMRVAPIELQDLGNHTIMQAWAPHILINGSSLVPQLGFVFVPLTVARILLGKGMVSDPAVDVQWILDNSVSDVYITVNNRIPLAVFDSDCVSAEVGTGHYSIITSMLHEIMHGLGFYSHITVQSGSLAQHQGLGLYDGLMRYADGTAVVPNNVVANQLNLSHIQGKMVYIANQQLYNPQPYSQGSSLHHVANFDSIMSPYTEKDSCRFRFHQADVDVLNAMGWDCKVQDDTLEWSHPSEYKPRHTQICNNGECLRDGHCVDCTDPWATFVVAVIFFGGCIWLIFFVAYYPWYPCCNGYIGTVYHLPPSAPKK